MSYTLKGRLESRLAAALAPLFAACALAAALHDWWPVELAGLMLGVGLALDMLAYHRALDYQPGWLALPLGLLELGLLVPLARALSIDAPLDGAIAFYAGAWIVAQVLGHAGFPLLRLSYAESGGELGRLGAGAAVLTLATLGTAGGVAWSQLPPTVHLSAGFHRGPLVITRRERLIGERGAVVTGGIVVRASDVTIRNVSVFGGEYGIEVEEARRVVLDRVRVVGASLDGIHVRRSQVTIKDCSIDSPSGYTQGIDISFSADKGMSIVEGCTVVGGREGIVIDASGAMVHGNSVSGTSLRAISMNEMSMGMIERNEVAGGLGVGIFCGDQSECMIEDNRISGTRADLASGDAARMGYAIESHYKSKAELSDNELVGNARRVGAFAGAEIHGS
jgi:parallel beta helix pectate lyase-like protein